MRSTTKFRTKLFAAGLAGGVFLSALGMAVPIANAATVPGSSITSEFSGLADQMKLPAAPTAQIKANFATLPDAKKATLVKTLKSDRPWEALELGDAKTSTVAKLVSGVESFAAQQRAAVYNVTSNFSKPTYILGVNTGAWNLRYNYNTGSGRVLSDNYCEAWYSGYTGFWNFSISTNKWIANGEGTCIGLFRGSIVYQGSGLTMNKEAGMTVNGPGILRTWLNNI
ncbi:hypothetical protein [Psychromicrobium sp. YIM B11713]|uniref:hypothetical protein n=1 Tax=Psychromicrobium sp. YIM B11713 TaxID=3145233 RepID=UPI00374FC87E